MLDDNLLPFHDLPFPTFSPHPHFLENSHENKIYFILKRYMHAEAI